MENSLLIFPDQKRFIAIYHTGFMGYYILSIENITDKDCPVIQFAKFNKINMILPIENFSSMLVGLN